MYAWSLQAPLLYLQFHMQEGTTRKLICVHYCTVGATRILHQLQFRVKSIGKQFHVEHKMNILSTSPNIKSILSLKSVI
jgi:hypothetical protein